MPEERRTYTRLDLRFNVAYRIIGTQKLGKSLTKNISGAGVRFLAEHPLPAGSSLEVTMRLPEREQPITFIGEVVWSEPREASEKLLGSNTSEVGLRFVKIDPKDHALIVQYAAFYGPPG